MRIAAFILLLFTSSVAWAKGPKSPVQRTHLFNGFVQIDIPVNMHLDSEYFHYWDNCPNGGYTATYSAKQGKKSGMAMQLNVHDRPENPVETHEHYSPQQHAAGYTVIKDTAYAIGSKYYYAVATVPKSKGKVRNSRHTPVKNYNLSYYIIAEGRQLELHYSYWDGGKGTMQAWEKLSERMTHSIQWQSGNWAVMAQR